MQSPPKPWTSHADGGYLLSQVGLIRSHSDTKQQMETICNMQPQRLYPTLDSLNYLGSIPWKVNTRILDLVVSIFISDGSEELGVPQPPTKCPSVSFPTKTMTSAEKAAVYRG